MPRHNGHTLRPKSRAQRARLRRLGILPPIGDAQDSRKVYDGYRHGKNGAKGTPEYRRHTLRRSNER